MRIRTFAFVLIGASSFALTYAAHAACSNETLQGRYAFRTEADPISGGKRLNLALLEFHGD